MVTGSQRLDSHFPSKGAECVDICTRVLVARARDSARGLSSRWIGMYRETRAVHFLAFRPCFGLC